MSEEIGIKLWHNFTVPPENGLKIHAGNLLKDHYKGESIHSPIFTEIHIYLEFLFFLRLPAFLDFTLQLQLAITIVLFAFQITI